LEDWDDKTLFFCFKRLEEYKSTAEAFHAVRETGDALVTGGETSGYQVSFPTTSKVEKNQLINVSESLVFVGFLDIYKWQIITIGDCKSL
jgi:hypothetical protein